MTRARRLLRRLLADERGTTLPELLVGVIVGTVVLAAGFGLLALAVDRSAIATRRVDSADRGRVAMDAITRQLGSMRCLGIDSPALVAADASTLTFNTDLSGGVRSPERHRLTFDATARTLTEDDYAGTGMPPSTTFPANPTRTRRLLSNVTALAGVPVFRYYAFATSGVSGATSPLTTPLSSADRGRTVRISVSFVVQPDATGRFSAQATTLQDDVLALNADPERPTGGPQCVG